MIILVSQMVRACSRTDIYLDVYLKLGKEVKYGINERHLNFRLPEYS